MPRENRERLKNDPRRDPAYIQDMIEAGERIAEIVKTMTFDDYRRDSLRRAALERNIEITGEAARRVSMQTRDSAPEVPWRQIAAARHRISHEYDDLDETILWRILTEHVPATPVHLRTLLARLDKGSP